MTLVYEGDRGATLEVVEAGDGRRFRVDRPGLGAVSVLLRGDELARFQHDLAETTTDTPAGSE